METTEISILINQLTILAELRVLNPKDQEINDRYYEKKYELFAKIDQLAKNSFQKGINYVKA